MVIDTNTPEGKELLEFMFLRHAREAAAYKSWCDLLSHFDGQQRKHIANLLAHDWHIGAVTLRNTTEGRDYTDVVVASQ